MIAAGWFFLQYQFQDNRQTGEALFEIQPGQSVKSIAEELEKERIIKDSLSFLLGYRFFYSGKSLKAGEYYFQFPLSEQDVLKKIIAGEVRLYSITVPEGLTRRETAHILGNRDFMDSQEFLNATNNPGLIHNLDPQAPDLEGYLFPETYQVSKNITSSKMAEIMVAQFRQIFLPIWENRHSSFPLTFRETIILASLIEKETSLSEEKPLVSAVFHNRLRRGMRLACDPTIIYALKKRGEFTGNLTKKHLKMDSSYNTYLYPGLPPGPIANPGAESLHAALFPADADYLYFVSRNDGSHKFSKTLREHVNAVNKYQKRRPP